MSKYDKFEGHTTGPWEIANEDGLLCLCDETSMLAELYDFENSEQTHNLIADAPALLAACKRKDELLRDILEGFGETYLLPETRARIKDELNREEI